MEAHNKKSIFLYYGKGKVKIHNIANDGKKNKRQWNNQVRMQYTFTNNNNINMRKSIFKVITTS